MSFLHIDKTQIVEILPQVRQELTYSTWPISWVLKSWRCKEPGHQQPWYLLWWTRLIQSLHVTGLTKQSHQLPQLTVKLVIKYMVTSSAPIDLSDLFTHILQDCFNSNGREVILKDMGISNWQLNTTKCQPCPVIKNLTLYVLNFLEGT